MVPLADTIYMFLKKAKPLGSSFSNMYATLTERVPITLVNTYLAMHLWTGDHTVRAEPVPNGHFLVKYLWYANGLSLLTICFSVAEFEASEAIDFEIADISQSSGYYFLLLAYRFAEVSSRMIFLSCVGTTFMTFVIIFDIFAMFVSHLGFWGTILIGPWLVAVMFVPFTTIDIWRLRKFLPQYLVMKALEALVMIIFGITIHQQVANIDVSDRLKGVIFTMSSTQRTMLNIGMGLWVLQYVFLYFALHVGHKYYARVVPSPSDILRQINKMFTIACAYTVKKSKSKKKSSAKKPKSPMKKTQVLPESKTEAKAMTTVVPKAPPVVLEDYTSSGDEAKVEKQPVEQKTEKPVSGHAALETLLKEPGKVEDGEGKPKPKKRKKATLKRKGTMML